VKYLLTIKETNRQLEELKKQLGENASRIMTRALQYFYNITIESERDKSYK